MIGAAVFFRGRNAGLAILLVCSLFMRAQQTQYYSDPELNYRKGLELFDAKNYLSARQQFETLIAKHPSVVENGNEVMRQNVDFYIAACAAEVNDKDAEQLLQHYLRHHHETDKRRLVHLYLGKYFYRNGRYAEVAEQLAQVDIKDLNNDQIYDYRFMLAYSYFTKKKFKEARPLFSSIIGIKEKYFYPTNYYYAFICFYEKDYNEALKSFKAIEDSKMYASVIPYYIAQIYYLKKDFDMVLSYIPPAVAKDGVLYKDEMNFLLGQVYFQKADYSKALPLLEAYISKNQKVNQEHIYQLAYCQYQTGAYNKAIDNFKQLNLLDDKMGQNATYALADCYLKTNQKDKARSAFQSVVSMQHDVTLRENALYNYGKLSFELNYLNEAILSFEDYQLNYEKGKYTAEVNEMLAAALVQTKNYDRAYRLMEKIKPESPMLKSAYQKVTYFRAVEYYNDKNYNEALSLCNKSLNYNHNAEIYALCTYLKAEINYSKQNYAEAITGYMKFSALTSPALEKKSEASKFRAQYNIAYAYFKQKQYEDAVVYFSSAVSEASKSSDTKGINNLMPDLYLRYADCLFVTKSYQKSIDAYAKIVSEQWPAAEYALFQKGIVSGLAGRDNEKVSALQLLLTKYPASVYADKANYEIAETYLSSGNLASARTSFQSLISKYATSNYVPKCYLQLAVIEYNSNKKELAVENYKTVAKKYPETSEAKEALDALKDLYVELGRAEEYFDFVKGNSALVITDAEQDSIYYKSAINAFNANDCNKAVSLFASYINRFPSGYFINDVYWKQAECYLKLKDYKNALPALDGVIRNRYAANYEKAVLKASGIAYFELKDYQSALSYYKLLYTASSSQQNTYTAMLGMMQCADKLKLSNEVVEYADQFINSGMAREADLQEAYYLKGKSYYAIGEKDFSLGAFNRVAEFPVNEKCVESKYMVAKILHENTRYKQSLDTCSYLKNKYAGYEYWVVKTFILMADNYSAMGNTFQAKATLESIVQNYEGDAAVLQEATDKLNKLKTEELNKSKIMMMVPSDTLIMESDSILNRQP